MTSQQRVSTWQQFCTYYIHHQLVIMKPPSRRRSTPSRFLDLKKTESKSRFRPFCRPPEQRSLLFALKKQTENRQFNTQLDFLALHKTFPKWSLLQIQNVIKFLKRCVAKRVFLQVHKQQREERKNQVPIEIWAELSQKMAGVHVETISSAFSQMLVIAATEPCSLSSSDPPRTTESQSTNACGLCTIPLRPMPKPHSGSPSPVMGLPKERCKIPQSLGKEASPNPSVQTTTVTSPSANGEDQCSELLQKSTGNDPVVSSTSATTESPLLQSVSQSTPPVSASSDVSIAISSLTSDTVQPDKPPESRQSEEAWHHRPNGMKSVDFEKVYQFFSNIVLNKPTQPLTAMESAVLLDLLMSLPEELPLLDCKELQFHLLQVHERLNTPAAFNLASTKENEKQTSKENRNRPDSSLQTQTVQSTGSEIVQEGAVTEQEKAVGSQMTPGGFAGQSTAVNDKGDWVVAGLCPLNPFMLPIALLKRQ